MVEVTPGKTDIKIQSGWLIFTFVATVIGIAVFVFVEPTGWIAATLWGIIALGLLADWWFFHAPGLMMIFFAFVLACLAFWLHLY